MGDKSDFLSYDKHIFTALYIIPAATTDITVMDTGMIFIIVILSTLTVVLSCEAEHNDSICSPATLSVLVLVPYPDFRINSGWSHGLELLPAARIAAQEINNRSDMLPGYKLSLIEASSDTCGLPIASLGLSNFVRYALSNRNNDKAIAVTGLACSTGTAAVSMIAGRPEVDLIQISMSNSPILRDKSKYKRLWHIIPSSTVFINTTLSLIRHFSWEKITILYSEGSILAEATADAFIKTLSNTSIQFESIGIRSSRIFIHRALDLIQAESSRIIFASVSSLDDLSHLMCEALARGLTWPCYSWIFQLFTYNELLIEQSFCPEELLSEAMNMSIMMNFRLENHENDVLVSGKTYGQFHEEYLRELQKLKSEDFVQQYLSNGYNYGDNGDLYANAMYDEIWALGLALNESLSDLKEIGLSLSEYSYNNTPITNILQKHLYDISFNGAVSKVSFRGKKHETDLPIHLHQIRNNASIHIGVYSLYGNNLSLWNISGITFPLTHFNYEHSLIPFPVTVYLHVEACLIFVFTIITMSLMIYLWRTPEVRASSPILTMLIFCGAYMCLASSTLAIIHQSNVIDPLIYTVLCNIIHRLSAYGTSLMITTVLVKLVRISHVFNHFGYTGKIWRDHYLFFFILLMSLIIPGVIDIIITLTATGLFKHNSITQEGEHCSTCIIMSHCYISSFLVWKVFSIGLTLLPIISLVPFSLCTRKVQLHNFKDTKKTLAFVFCTVLVSGLVTPLIVNSQVKKDENNYAVYQSILMHMVVLLTIGFFVSTKVYPACCQRKVSKIATVTSSIDVVSDIIYCKKSKTLTMSRK